MRSGDRLSNLQILASETPDASDGCERSDERTDVASSETGPRQSVAARS
jgi:hypothetical protein